MVLVVPFKGLFKHVDPQTSSQGGRDWEMFGQAGGWAPGEARPVPSVPWQAGPASGSCTRTPATASPLPGSPALYPFHFTLAPPPPAKRHSY